MLNDGAAGNTAKEITSVIGFGEGKTQAVNEFCKKLIEEAPKTDPSVTLEIANIVIGNDYRHVGFEPQYEWDMQDYYRAEITNLDFSQKTETLAEVNGWCNDKTHGMIPEILKESELKANALLLLMNAIYFKATWTEKFDPADTRDNTFTTEGGQTLSLPMMHRKALAQYSENDFCTMLNLPYGSGDKWSMKVLLPREGKTVDDVIASLNAESWQQLRYSGWGPIVDIEIPRFKTTFETNLIEPLSALGAPTMFMPSVAEFPNICSNYKKDIYVFLMKQKAAIEVDEEGTKASAVTVAGLVDSAGGPWGIEKPMNVDFHANRPFVYVIQEASSGVIFFLGTYRGE
jgi:serpin B